MNRILVITGPTATGKTALGVKVAQMLGGEVVSADSMQIYRHMDIGTAKPSPDEMMGVPHHMIDVAQPDEEYSVSRYAEEASRCVDDIQSRGKLPIIVGGTGLYIEALIRGVDYSPTDAAVRDRLSGEYDALGGEAMLLRLRELDPESAARLHANDKKRIVRALEIFALTGETITEHDRKTRLRPPRYDAVTLALTFADRQALYDRIDKRVDIMMERGLPDEVRKLLNMGITRRHTAMQAIGYKELAAALSGECGMTDAIDKIKQESRRYAKRQLSWLRRDAGIRWITWDGAVDLEHGARVCREACITQKREGADMDKFEYKTIFTDAKGVLGGRVDKRTFESEMNTLGNEGWELVSTVGANQSYGSTRWIISIFKRRIEE